MKKTFIFLFVLLSVSSQIIAQDDVLLEIDNHKIDVNEFLHIYQKNNNDANSMTFDAMMDYMDLFVNFKLKVIEAESLGLDTTKEFKVELNGYRQQLAQPYLTDKTVEDELILEAYARMKQDVNVSHILIKVDQNALPEDTLKAYNKVMGVYERLKKGEDFTTLAIAVSEDESVKYNNGDLGWRTVFGLVYEFETEMYKTDIGKFSQPFRTRFGYHILKVNGKRPAKGKYKVAHIMLTIPKDATPEDKVKAEARLNEVQAKINAGDDFAALAREYSEDRQTAGNGGVLGWIDVGGKMIRSFEDAVFGLTEINQVSEPLKTSYGWHFIKLLEKQEIKPFEEVRSELKSKISNSARASRSREVVIERLKKEYNFTLNQKAAAAFYKLVTDSIFAGSWDATEALKLDNVLCEFGDKKLYQKDFADFLDKMNRKQVPQPIVVFVDNALKSFIDKQIIEYEQSRLEMKYPQFKYLMQEYHDGILLFELTDQLVWTKAVTDTAGLQVFYENNKDNYMWPVRYEIHQYKCNSPKNAVKVEKLLKKGADFDQIVPKLSKKDSTAVVAGTNGKFVKLQSAETDNIISKSGLSETPGKTAVFLTDETTVVMATVIAPEHKKLEEAKGLITADYQNYLETDWIKKLRSKYKILLHEDVLKKVAKN